MTKVERAYKALGQEMINELAALDSAGLKAAVVTASEAIKQAGEELEANDKYQAMREAIKDMTAGKRELDKRQKAIITVALTFIAEKGGA